MENTTADKKEEISIAKALGLFDLVIAFPFILFSGFMSSQIDGKAGGVDLYAILFLVRGILTLMRWRIAWVLHLLFCWVTASILAAFFVMFSRFYGEHVMLTAFIVITVFLIVTLLLPGTRKEFNR